MLQIALRRIALAPITLFVLVSFTFLMIRLAPGGPFDGERELPPEVIEALNEQFYLDKPLPKQYLNTLKQAITFDFGSSMKHRDRTVREIIREHLPNSIKLGALAISIAICVGLVAGMTAALNANKFGDWGTMLICVIGISLPTFVFGPILQLIFGMKLKWLPIAGFETPNQIILPAITLALPFSARIARLARTGFLEVLKEDYVMSAKARGSSMARILIQHVLPAAVRPVVSYLGPAIAGIVTGSLVVEMIFLIPGLGREFVEGALNRDYPLIMGTTFVYGSFIICSNLTADLLNRWLDPQSRGAEE
ncbi:MAG: ABC transporter permease [Lentisphaeria bacterium]|nr:ABC transporter permease [Lentisphaeria bacterium]